MPEAGDLITKSIRQLRKDAGMTQLEFANALKVTPTSIHRWEAGTSSPEFELVVSLWSLAIERGSATSKHFAEFLLSRTDAIRPLFQAKELPQIKALEEEILSLSAEQRRLAFAFIRMLKHSNDETAKRIVRTLLDDWADPTAGSQSLSGKSKPSTSTSRNK